MRVSRLYKKEEIVERDRVPLARALIWGAFALILLTGIVLYFKYEPSMTPLV